MSDRRRWRRLESEIPVRLEVPGRATGVTTSVGTHLNPNGLFVKMADPPPIGTRVRVIAEIGVGGALASEGSVVDRAVLEDQMGREPGVGIEFDETERAWEQIYRLMLATADPE